MCAGPIDFYYVGATVTLVDNTQSHKPEKKTFILAETFEPGCFFQLICITGYYAGRMEGYIGTDPIALKEKVRGVTRQFLVAELKRNLIFDESTLIITKK